MSNYAVQTWTNGVSVANAARMGTIESGIAAVPGVYFLTTPYLLISAVTINVGVTNNYTCTGGATGVPAGAKAVLINAYFSPSALGTYLQFKPHSATVVQISNYPLIGTAQATGNVIAGSVIVPVDGSGVIDATAATGNCANINASIYGYVY